MVVHHVHRSIAEFVGVAIGKVELKQQLETLKQLPQIYPPSSSIKLTEKRK